MPGRKLGLALVIFAVGAGFIMATTLFMGLGGFFGAKGCSSIQTPEREVAVGFSFPQGQQYDFGRVQAGANLETTVPVRNSSWNRIDISKARAKCSDCGVTARFEKNVIEPGETVPLHVALAAARRGPQQVTVTLVGEHESPLFDLTICYQVPWVSSVQ